MIPFPKALSTLSPDESIPDLFLPSGMRHAEAGDSGSGVGHAELRIRAAGFEEQYKLTGVMINARVHMAVVNGMWVEIGQSLSGCRLTIITGTEAEFHCPDGPVTLRLSEAQDHVPH